VSGPKEFNVLFLSDRASSNLKFNGGTLFDLIENKAHGRVMSETLEDLCGRGTTPEQKEKWATAAKDALMEAHAVIIDYRLLTSQNDPANPFYSRYLASLFSYGMAQARPGLYVLLVSETPVASPNVRPEFIYWLFDKLIRDNNNFVITDPKVLLPYLIAVRNYANAQAKGRENRSIEARLRGLSP